MTNEQKEGYLKYVKVMLKYNNLLLQVQHERGINLDVELRTKEEIEEITDLEEYKFLYEKDEYYKKYGHIPLEILKEQIKVIEIDLGFWPALDAHIKKYR